MIGSHILAATAAVRLLAAGNSGAHDSRLIIAALVGIALITFLKLNPFLSLTIGAVLVGAIAGPGPDKTVTSFGTGVGSTAPATLPWAIALRPRCPR